ncbi:Lung seven transmembrane receptor-like [Arabidopsis suecica]|uniref:Lung seven transmembrane receptor-like n=1 Tax=Arabidopsis suecica TaxID=45249 RepID=A0A8T2HDS1_ARASU|nr:Lung seven transmembrane receptor-like [Arabidopsis suecica]
MKNRSLGFWAIGFLLIGSLIGTTEGSIHEYNNEKFTAKFNARFFHGGSEGLYASKSQDLNSSSSSDNPFKGKSFIRFDDVTFVRTKESASKQNAMQSTSGLVEAIILEVKDRDRIGGTFLKSEVICCTPELADTGSCSLGEVIIKRESNDVEWPRQIKTFFKGNKTEVNMSPETVVINKTGMYYLYFMICDPELDGTRIKGRTVWKNPDGYLPGKVAPLMNVFGFMSLAYILLGLVWFVRFVQFWKDIIQLHYHITLVIALGMCEMAVRYFEYVNFNSTGMRPMDVTLWAVTFSSIKKTLSRLLLLVVSMGYGVVKPTLGGITSRILLLGVIYFVATEALELVEHLGNINDFSGKTMIVLVIPVALLDACFILWIFSSLARTLEKLQIKRNMAKLELYRNFTNALAISVLLSIAWIGFELYFNGTDPLIELWRMAWIIPAFWNLLSYGLLAIICILWAPSNNPTRYSYLAETGDEFEEEGISLTGSGIKSTEDVERNELLFGLPDDVEEGKRE